MRKWIVGLHMGNRNQRKHVENDEKNDEYARNALKLDGEILKYVGILQGVAQGCTLPPNL